jgi:hypothetical protein
MYRLTKSPLGGKKFRVILPDGRKVDFGAKGYSDYTLHKDKARMKRYLVRHQKRENWTKSGVATAGFWSRWILWSEPNLRAAILKTQRVIGNKILYHK